MSALEISQSANLSAYDIITKNNVPALKIVQSTNVSANDIITKYNVPAQEISSVPMCQIRIKSKRSLCSQDITKYKFVN